MTVSSNRVPADNVKEPPFPLTPDESRKLIEGFSFWYHNIYLGNGVYTKGEGREYPEHVWSCFEKALPANLSGLSVLDVGTNAGYFALQMKLRSARQVVGTDFVAMFLEQAEAVRRIWGVEIDYRFMDVHDITKLDQTFDIVVFAGILYHLRNPLQVIEDLGRMCSDAILLETECIADDPRNCVVVRQGSPAELQTLNQGMMKFIEGSDLNGDPSNWWVPDTECVKGMLRTAGFTHFSRPVFFSNCRLCMVASKKSDTLLNLDAFGV